MGFGIKPKIWIKIARLGQAHQRRLNLVAGIASTFAILLCFVPSENSLQALGTKSRPAVKSLGPASLVNNAQVWSYSGSTAPENWGTLEENFSVCGTGTRQSPVDVPPRLLPQALPISISYHPTTTLFEDTGRTFALRPQGKSSVMYEGTEYQLKSVEFHSPSEHTVTGFNYPMEVQFIHTSAAGKTLGFAVFVEKGREATLFNSVLAKDNPSAKTKDINPKELLPTKFRGWSYSGSSTTPPCSEDMQWLVFADTVEFSDVQITEFRKHYPLNARPIQNMYERTFTSAPSVVSH